MRDRHLIHLRFSASESIGFSLPPGPECPWHKNGHKELIDLFDPSHGAQFLDHFLRYLPSIFAIFHSISHHFPLRFSHFRFPKDPVRFLSSPLSQLRNAAFFWSRCLRAILQVQVFILALSWRCSPSSMGVEMSNFRLNSIGPYKSLDLQTLEV